MAKFATALRQVAKCHRATLKACPYHVAATIVQAATLGRSPCVPTLGQLPQWATKQPKRQRGRCAEGDVFAPIAWRCPHCWFHGRQKNEHPVFVNFVEDGNVCILCGVFKNMESVGILERELSRDCCIFRASKLSCVFVDEIIQLRSRIFLF